MCNLSEYVYEKGFKKGYEEGYEIGYKEGLEIAEMEIIIVRNWLKEHGRDDDAEAFMIPENKEFRLGIFREYDEASKA